MTTRRTRRTVALAAALFVVLVAAPAASAKEGLEVKLAAPIQTGAKPGDIVPLFFTASALTDAGSRPLQGTDIFLRLYGPTGAMTEAMGAEQRERGLYKVLIEIPEGGAARAKFGIHGSSSNRPADIVWPYDGVLVAAAIPPPVDPDLFRLPNQPGYQPATEGNGAGPALATGDSAGGTEPATSSAAFAVDARALGIGGLLLAGFAGALALGLRHRRRGDPATI